MIVNGNNIITIRKLSSSTYKSKAGKQVKTLYGITIPKTVMKDAGLKPGRLLSISIVGGGGDGGRSQITLTPVNVKDVEKIQRQERMAQTAKTKTKTRTK